ncbi:MAG: hypothetical protein V4622_09495 [Bacteroidota bacterium]
MKVFNYILGLFLFVNLVSSCASISRVDDDDVYVSKNPSLPSGDVVNDETSYENYKFKRDKGNVNSVYSRSTMSNRFGGTNLIYSPYCDPFHYPQSYVYAPVVFSNGQVYNSGFYNGFYYHHYSPYNYDEFNNYSMFGSSYYGYPYYYGNPYGSINCWNNNNWNGNNWNNNNTNVKPQISSTNFHQGPRNSIAGVNNGRRSSASGMKGISTKPNTNIYAENKGSTTKSVQRTSSSPIKNGDTKTTSTSRPVTSGTGLSKSGTRVSTTNTNVRNSQSNSQSGAGTRVVNERSGSTNTGRSVTVESPKSSGGSTATPSRSGSTGGTNSGGRRP